MTEHSWPATPARARRIQRELRPLVETVDRRRRPPRTVAGVDVAYPADSAHVAAAVVVLDYRTLDVVEQATAVLPVSFPYVPGLFAFRELPPILAALERLANVPDLVVCDGHGRAHPMRFGLACHLGVLTDLPTIGVGKTPFVGEYTRPGQSRGDWSALYHQGELVGCALRTRDRTRPVFVSVGHRVSLDTARADVLHLSPRYRLPETTRRADRLARSIPPTGGSPQRAYRGHNRWNSENVQPPSVER